MPTRWYQRPDTNWRGRPRAGRVTFAPIIIILVLVLLLGFRWWLTGLGQALVVDQPPVPSDAILILGGGDGSRQERALVLYQAGQAPLLLSSGEAPKLPDFTRSFAEIGADYLVARGVPREAILLMPEPTSTYEEATASLKLAQSKGWTSLLVVTDAPHTRCSSLVFRHVYRGSGIRVTFVAAHPAWFRPDSWWTGELGAMVVVEEYGKLVLYLFRGYLF